MTMGEIERHCKAKAKRREARQLKLKADLDKNQKMIDDALASIHKEINDQIDK